MDLTSPCYAKWNSRDDQSDPASHFPAQGKIGRGAARNGFPGRNGSEQLPCATQEIIVNDGAYKTKRIFFPVVDAAWKMRWHYV